MAESIVYLLPGFFGFISLGRIKYFRGVKELLQNLLDERGLDVEVIESQTLPSASICRRCEVVFERMQETRAAEAKSVHLVGHSTGGLDARLLAHPGVRLVPGDALEHVAENIKSVVTISSPHYGSPFANYALLIPVRQAFENLAHLLTSDPGRYATVAAARLVQLVATLDDRFGRTATFLDAVSERLLTSITADPDHDVWVFLREGAHDQGAAVQLTLESMHLFNASVSDRVGVAYSSLLTATPQPPSRYGLKDFTSPARTARVLAFMLFHTLASRASHAYPYTAIDMDTINHVERPFDITKHTNDGFVPTQSQAYGRILGIIEADHLDIIGQYEYADGKHSDWLPSGAHFDRARFVKAWAMVADEIAANDHQAGHQTGHKTGIARHK